MRLEDFWGCVLDAISTRGRFHSESGHSTHIIPTNRRTRDGAEESFMSWRLLCCAASQTIGLDKCASSPIVSARRSRRAPRWSTPIDYVQRARDCWYTRASSHSSDKFEVGVGRTNRRRHLCEDCTSRIELPTEEVVNPFGFLTAGK